MRGTAADVCGGGAGAESREPPADRPPGWPPCRMAAIVEESDRRGRQRQQDEQARQEGQDIGLTRSFEARKGDSDPARDVRAVRSHYSRNCRPPGYDRPGGHANDRRSRRPIYYRVRASAPPVCAFSRPASIRARPDGDQLVRAGDDADQAARRDFPAMPIPDLDRDVKIPTLTYRCWLRTAYWPSPRPWMWPGLTLDLSPHLMKAWKSSGLGIRLAEERSRIRNRSGPPSPGYSARAIGSCRWMEVGRGGGRGAGRGGRAWASV